MSTKTLLLLLLLLPRLAWGDMTWLSYSCDDASGSGDSYMIAGGASSSGSSSASTPGGSATQLQYNNSASFGGVSGSSVSGSSVTFGGTVSGATLQSTAAAAGEMDLYDPTGAFYTGFIAPALSANAGPYTLPTADGSSGNVLSTNGAGVLSWSAGGGGASTTLNNLGTTAINAPLIFTPGTVTSSTPLIDMAQTWNAGGVTFTGFKFALTNTASAAASRIFDITIGGSSRFSVAPDGYTRTLGILASSGGSDLDFTTTGLHLTTSGIVDWNTAGIRLVYNAAQKLQLGSSSGTPAAYTIRGQAGTGADISGGNLTIVGGPSTGTGTGGSVILATTPASGSSSTENTTTTRLSIDSAGNINLPGTTANRILTVDTSKNVNTNSFSSAVLAAGVNDETGTGVVVFNTNPSFASPLLSTGQVLVTTQFDKTDTTLANITGLSVATATAKNVAFRARLFVDASVVGGGKYAAVYSSTTSAIKYEILCIDNSTNADVITSRQTSSGGSAGQAGATALYCTIEGAMVTTGAGNLTIQFAQNAANGTSSVLTMSDLDVWYTN